MDYGYHPPLSVSAKGSASGSSSGSGLHYFSSPYGDTTYSKVFVGGLAWETQSEMLKRYFEQFGEIFEAVVISDKNTGRSKGYGFVTFRHPESASRACANPSPIIDGRRANCNLASLGRPQPAPPYAKERIILFVHPMMGISTEFRPFQTYSHMEGLLALTFHEDFTLLALHIIKHFRTISKPSHTLLLAYGSEHAYPQNVYSPLMPQQYVQVYGVPGEVNPSIYLCNQLNQPISAAQGFTTMQGYTVPAHHLIQPGGPNITGSTASLHPAIQAPYPVVIPVAAQPQFIIPANSSQFMHGSRSDHAAS